MKTMTIALAGNPNSGKTTLMNAITGTRHQVGNWPGVTVEKKEGVFQFGEYTLRIVDLPGVYSLSPFTIEERIAREFLLAEKPDAVINLVDACNMERNLYLTTQLIELNVPMVIALNMMDEAEKKGFEIDPERMTKALGVPVVPISAIEERGLDVLLHKAVELSENHPLKAPNIEYGPMLEGMIGKLAREIQEHSIPTPAPERWLAIKALEQDAGISKLVGEDKAQFLKVENNYSDAIASHKYSYITKIIHEVVAHPQESAYAFSDKLDRVFLHKWLGIPIFLLIMGLVFKLTFDIGGVFVDMLDGFFSGPLSEAVRQLLGSVGVADWLIRLLVDGVIGGVGGVLTFLPNIAILFLAISLLEDSGYMARAAFLLDQWMQKVGLNGKTFIPMVLGFGCNVPGIMAARTLENEKDRLIAILINPFMSCGARFPVYVLIASAFFPGREALVTYSLYILGVVIALLAAWGLRKFVFKGEETHFIMELPTYRMPKLKFLALHVWDRVKDYLMKAGTFIFAASVILWFMLNYGFHGPAEITESFGALFGKATAFIFTAQGFNNWQASLSLFSGIAAKEIVVANMSIIYGLGDSAGAEAFRQALSADFNPLKAYSFMVFVLLYTPCAAVIGVIRRETGSWKWTAFSVFFQFFVAWVVSAIIYQLGLLIVG